MPTSTQQERPSPNVASSPENIFRFLPSTRYLCPTSGRVQPILIGPITDLLTFYADVQLAMRQKNLLRTGDHIYVKHGRPNSWADGTYTVFGQDSIDFDITLTEVDQAAHEAALLIRHVPPVQAQIQFPATWMIAPVGDHPNNWGEGRKDSSGQILGGGW